MKDVDEKYKHLLGKEVKYVKQSGETWTVIPVGICRKKGITCVEAIDTKQKVICLNKKTYHTSTARVPYNEAFDNIIEMLEAGTYVVAVARKFRAGRNGTVGFSLGDLSACAFE